jgi:aspartyl protease family protein
VKRCWAFAGLVALALLLADSALSAGRGVKDVHVVALFRDSAVVIVDGKRRLLRTGEISPEGIKLLSAASDEAVFEFEGKTLKRRLDGRSGSTGTTTAPTAEEIQIFRDIQGMYRTVGSINGLPVGFLVDTGASAIAMNAAQARRLGIDFRVDGEPTYVATASDVTPAYSVTLDVVKVGALQARNVKAVVMDGAMPDEVLLGMSFLGRMEMLNQSNTLILRRKY